MPAVKIQDKKVLIDADAPEPWPSIGKWFQKRELDSQKAAAWLNLLASTLMTVTDECLGLVVAAANFLLAYLKDYTIGLVKYATATAKATSSASATATVRR